MMENPEHNDNMHRPGDISGHRPKQETTPQAHRIKARRLRYTALAIYGITAAFFVYGLVIRPHHLRASDLWFVFMLFVLSPAMVFGSIWTATGNAWWRVVLGLALLVPSLIVWGLSLLLAFAGFRFH